MIEGKLEQQRMILFDGICNLCNASVIFVLQHEYQPIFKFASLQSEVGRKYWAGAGCRPITLKQ